MLGMGVDIHVQGFIQDFWLGGGGVWVWAWSRNDVIRRLIPVADTLETDASLPLVLYVYIDCKVAQFFFVFFWIHHTEHIQCNINF